MNPADECTAFEIFIGKGTSAEDVELAPVVFAALAAGTISLGVAQAYAVTNDVDKQAGTHARAFENLANGYYGENPDNIRRALVNDSVKETDATARFVGEAAYNA